MDCINSLLDSMNKIRYQFRIGFDQSGGSHKRVGACLQNILTVDVAEIIVLPNQLPGFARPGEEHIKFAFSYLDVAVFTGDNEFNIVGNINTGCNECRGHKHFPGRIAKGNGQFVTIFFLCADHIGPILDRGIGENCHTPDVDLVITDNSDGRKAFCDSRKNIHRARAAELSLAGRNHLLISCTEGFHDIHGNALFRKQHLGDVER